MLKHAAFFSAALALIWTPRSAIEARAATVNCTATKNDARLLNEAIAASRTGDQIAIHGTCLIDRTIVLAGNRSYLGESRTGTIIRQADGANLQALVASDSWYSDSPTTGEPVRIAHLTLDGNAASNTGTNALVIRSWLTVVEDLQIENAPGDGLQLTNTSRNNVALQNTEVNGRISNLFITNSGSNGIHVVDSGNSVTDWDLLDSWIASSGLSAINIDNAAGWKIRGNHLYGVPQHGIFANRCFGTSIQDNYIEDFGDSGGNSTWFGIACTVQGDAGSMITGNKVFMFSPEPASGKFIYIGLPQVNYGVGVMNVTNNVVRGAGTPNDIGLSYEIGNGQGLEVLSAGNNVQAVAQPRIVGAHVKLVEGY